MLHLLAARLTKARRARGKRKRGVPSNPQRKIASSASGIAPPASTSRL